MRLRFYILLFTFCVSFSYAQEDGSRLGAKNVGAYIGGADMYDLHSKAFLIEINFIDIALHNKESNKLEIEGSPLLYDNWNNFGVAVVGNKNYHLNNLNYNVKEDMILSKINKDSAFVFDFKNIDKIILNGKEFKQFYNNSLKQKKIHEVIYEDNNLALLKNYFIVVTEGSPNPMLNRPHDKMSVKSGYYIKRDNIVKPFKWNKRSIISLIDKDKRGEFEEYVERNDLSYKEEADVGKMLKIFLSPDLIN